MSAGVSLQCPGHGKISLSVGCGSLSVNVKEEVLSAGFCCWQLLYHYEGSIPADELDMGKIKKK